MQKRSWEEVKNFHVMRVGYAQKTIVVYLPKEPKPDTVIEVEVEEPGRFGPPQATDSLTFTPTSLDPNEWLGEGFSLMAKRIRQIYP